MNYGQCLSYQKGSFRLKQEQALGFLCPVQNLNTNNQLSSIGENQRDVRAIHHFFQQLHAMLRFLHHVHQQTIVETLELLEDTNTHLLDSHCLWLHCHYMCHPSLCNVIPHMWGICAFRQTHLCTKCNRQGIHVFSSTPYPQDIISSLPRSDFWVTCYVQEAYSSIKKSNSMKLLSLQPNLAFEFTKANTADNHVKVVHPEYNDCLESLCKLS